MQITKPKRKQSKVARGLKLVQNMLRPSLFIHLLRLANFKSNYYLEGMRKMKRGKTAKFAADMMIANGERIEVGDRTVINHGTTLLAGQNTGRIIIGEDVLIGPYCTMTCGSYGFNLGVPANIQPMLEDDIRIGNDVWLGAMVMVMPGVTIGDHTIVAANAVITHDVEPWSIVAGVPARVIGTRTRPDSE
jgi:acetyltransferase-like isoleucine patch superfamily enzyme